MRRESRWIFSPALLRWMNFCERCNAYGFPSVPESAAAAGRVHLINTGGEYGTKAVEMLLGDTMHVGCLGLVVGVALSCIEYTS